MQASVLTGKAKPDRMDDVIRFCHTSVLPAMKGHAGYKGMILLGNHDTHQFIVVSLWETLADLLAAEAGAYLQAQFREMRILLVRPLENEHYLMSIQD